MVGRCGLTSRLATEKPKSDVRRMGSQVGKQQKNQTLKGCLETAGTECPFKLCLIKRKRLR